MSEQKEPLEKLRELLEGIDFAMMTTVSGGKLHSRPMSTQEPDDNRYVSVFGRAEVSHDRAKMEELWNPIHKAWFPDGLADPNICLIRVRVEEAEYWDAPSSTLVQLAGFAKALVTGKEADYGENEKIGR